MSKLAKRIVKRIKRQTRGTDIAHVSDKPGNGPSWLERWAQIIDEELAKCEDAEDRAAIKKALKEGGPSIPWEQVKKELGTYGRRTWMREELHERPGDAKREQAREKAKKERGI